MFDVLLEFRMDQFRTTVDGTDDYGASDHSDASQEELAVGEVFHGMLAITPTVFAERRLPNRRWFTRRHQTGFISLSLTSSPNEGKLLTPTTHRQRITMERFYVTMICLTLDMRLRKLAVFFKVSITLVQSDAVNCLCELVHLLSRRFLPPHISLVSKQMRYLHIF
jgi:hypothetical protein